MQDPFAKVAKAIGLKKNITPKAGRRMFQDLTRHAAIDHAVKKSISGHATDAMVVRYSTAHEDEQREAIGNVVDIATAKRPAPGKANRSCGPFEDPAAAGGGDGEAVDALP